MPGLGVCWGEGRGTWAPGLREDGEHPDLEGTPGLWGWGGRGSWGLTLGLWGSGLGESHLDTRAGM